jgi:hypothetical protein
MFACTDGFSEVALPHMRISLGADKVGGHLRYQLHTLQNPLLTHWKQTGLDLRPAADRNNCVSVEKKVND